MKISFEKLFPCDGYDGIDAAQRGDYKTALHEWRPLAEQGDAGGQYNMGVLYYYGEGVSQDYILAHMWFSLAVLNGNERGIKGIDIVAKEMTPEQIAEAQKLARDWMAKNTNN